MTLGAVRCAPHMCSTGYILTDLLGTLPLCLGTERRPYRHNDCNKAGWDMCHMRHFFSQNNTRVTSQCFRSNGCRVW
jgi:hypothetical protein